MLKKYLRKVICGNHIKIVDGDIATVYAHCKTIYVTLQEEFGGKYSDIPYSNEERSAMDEQMNDIPF